MATKKLIIETEVKTDGLDKAVQKVGELKKLSNKISIQYDIDGKPLDVVIDKTLNLGQQVKVLTAELRKTKEGTAEFTLLNSKLKDTQDDLTRVNAKSRDLFASFSLIPGPIGDIFGKLNGVIGLLKTFSGFTIKDFGNQFKEFGKDITGIFDAIFGLNKEIDQTTTTLNDNTEAQDENTGATDEGTTATNAGTVANQKQTESIEGLTKVEKNYVDLNKEKVQGLQDNIKVLQQGITVAQQNIKDAERSIAFGRISLEDGNKQIQVNKDIIAGKELKIKTTQDEIAALQKESTAIQQNTGDTTKNTGAKEVNTGATAAYTAGTQAATFATTAFNIALKALGIGLIIGLVVGLFEVFKKLGTQLYDTTKQFIYGKEQLQQYKDATTKNIEASETAANKILEVGVAFEQAAKGTITKKKALEIYNEILGGTIGEAKTLEEAEKLYKDNTAGYIKSVGLRAEAQELFALAAKQSALASQVELQGYFEWFFDFDRKLGESAVEKFVRVKGELLSQGEDFRNRAKTLLAEALEAQKNFKPKDEKKPDTPDIKKIENDNKAANALLLKLQQENSVNRLNEERKRQDAQLKIDKENEEREVNNLKLSKDKEELRAKLLEQIKFKYGIKVIELNKKRQEEDNKSFDESQKKIKEYNDKVFEIMNAADENELSRNKAALERKYADDVTALQKETEFQKQSKIEQERIILALEKAKNQAIQKLDDEDAQDKRDKNLKRLDDELRLLDVKNKALIEGTKTYFKNQRDILEAANKKELADLEDRAIKEKLTVEQIAKEKEVINKAYLASLKDISKQELQVLAEQVQASLGVVQTALGDLSKVAQLGQQVDLEQAKKRFIAQNELDQKQATSKEQLEKKLIDNQKKFAKEEDDIKRRAFEENKKIQIAQAIIATLQSAIGAFSSLAPIPVVGPFLAAAAAASALVFGYRQVDLIKKTQYQSSLDLSNSQEIPERLNRANPGRNYEKGGMIGGKRHAEGGTLIEAEQGEAIMTRGAVTQFAPLLSLMNQAGGGVSFNSNLMTTRQDNPILSNPVQEQSPLIVKTYVVSQELTTEAHRQARLKNLSTI
jgi:nicotinamide mononucleotide adenylyltransferase